MRAAIIAAVMLGGALPASAQDYFGTAAAMRHGHGYAPAAIVAGWEGEVSFVVVAIAPDGQRVSGGAAPTEWKATVITGPRAAADDDDEEDERYQDKLATNPKPSATRAGPPVARTETVYTSLTCPAIVARMEALKPVAGFEYDPPALAGNQDGGKGDGREGYDLWLRVGNAELTKSAETRDAKLAVWFDATVSALKACPAAR